MGGMAASVVLLTVLIIRYTDKDGKPQEIKVDLPPGATNPQIVPPSREPDNPLPGPGVAPIPQGDPLSPLALVRQPAKIEGVQSWTVETIGHRGAISVLAYNPDGAVLAAASAERTIRLWDNQTGKLVRIIPTDEVVLCLAWSPDGKTLSACQWPSKASFWEVSSGRKLHVLNNAGYTIAWMPDSKSLIAFNNDQVRLWEFPSFQPLNRYAIHGSSAAVSPDGKTLAFIDSGVVHLLTAQTGEQSAAFGEKIEGSLLSWSPDGKRLAIRPGEKSGLQIWDPFQGKLVANVDSKEPDWAYGYFAWSPDSKTLAILRSGPPSSRFDIAEAASGKTIYSSDEGRTTGAVRVAWCPDGKTLLLGDSFTYSAVAVYGLVLFETSTFKKLRVHDYGEALARRVGARLLSAGC